MYEGVRANEKKRLRDDQVALVESFLSTLGDANLEVDRKFVHQIQGDVKDKLSATLEASEV